jgi:hypothetical protein
MNFRILRSKKVAAMQQKDQESEAINGIATARDHHGSDIKQQKDLSRMVAMVA